MRSYTVVNLPPPPPNQQIHAGSAAGAMGFPALSGLAHGLLGPPIQVGGHSHGGVDAAVGLGGYLGSQGTDLLWQAPAHRMHHGQGYSFPSHGVCYGGHSAQQAAPAFGGHFTGQWGADARMSITQPGLSGQMGQYSNYYGSQPSFSGNVSFGAQGYANYGNQGYGAQGYANYGAQGYANYGQGYANYANQGYANYGAQGYANYANYGNYGNQGYASYANQGYASYANQGYANYGNQGYASYANQGYASYANQGYASYANQGYSPGAYFGGHSSCGCAGFMTGHQTGHYQAPPPQPQPHTQPHSHPHPQPEPTQVLNLDPSPPLLPVQTNFSRVPFVNPDNPAEWLPASRVVDSRLVGSEGRQGEIHFGGRDPATPGPRMEERTVVWHLFQIDDRLRYNVDSGRFFVTNSDGSTRDVLSIDKVIEAERAGNGVFFTARPHLEALLAGVNRGEVQLGGSQTLAPPVPTSFGRVPAVGGPQGWPAASSAVRSRLTGNPAGQASIHFNGQNPDTNDGNRDQRMAVWRVFQSDDRLRYDVDSQNFFITNPDGTTQNVMGLSQVLQAQQQGVGDAAQIQLNIQNAIAQALA